MRLEFSTTLTERDKKLLSFLGVVLVCAAFWFLAIKPLLAKYEENKNILEDQQILKHTNATKETLYENLLEYDVDIEEKAEESASGFFEMLSSDEIDELLTDLALSCDLEAKELTIDMPTEPAELEAYRYAETDETEETASSSAKAIYDVDGQEAATEAAGATEETAQTATASGIYKAAVSMELTGTQKNLRKMLDALNEDYDAILVTGYTFSDTLNIYTGSGADGEDVSQEGEKALAVDMDVYMYATEEEAAQIQKGAEE